MPRDLNFDPTAPNFQRSLVTRPDKQHEIETITTRLVHEGKTLREIVEYFNHHVDLNDSEWAAFLYGLGAFSERMQLIREGLITMAQGNASILARQRNHTSHWN